MYKVVKFFEHIQSDSRLLNLQEKIVVNHIWGYQADGKCCFSSNEYLGYLICEPEGLVDKMLRSLALRKIIKIHYPSNGTTRMLSVITGNSNNECETNDIEDVFNF